MIQAIRRPSARLRLTAMYGGLFLVAGAALLAITYVLVRQTLPTPPSDFGLGNGPGIKGSGLFATTQGSITIPDAQNQRAVIAVANQVQQQVLSTLLIESGVALGLMALLSVLLGWIVAGRVLRPVHQITATARRLSQQTLHERIGLVGPQDEMKELADTFDAMLARLDAAFESQRRFVANASHELRTPLSTQRALVDVNLADPHASPAQLRATLEKIRTVTDESEQLVMSLLALAKSERGLEHRTPVDLATIAREVSPADGQIPTAAWTGHAEGLRVETSFGAATVSGDRALLRRMVGNLVDNATRYNIRHGWINLATGTHNSHAFVRVSNSGRKIPDQMVTMLFEPFRRLDGDRLANGAGAGLGLSIVRAIAIAHGGQVTARPLAEGGLEVAVTLPVAE